MLFVLLNTVGDTYAIKAARVREIVPFAKLKTLPSDQPEIRGLLDYHGTAVPVLDLTWMLTGSLAREVLSTRILITTYAAEPETLLGLVCEGANAVARLETAHFQPPGITLEGRTYLGKVIEHEGRLIQWIEIENVLTPAAVRALQAKAATELELSHEHA